MPSFDEYVLEINNLKQKAPKQEALPDKAVSPSTMVEANSEETLKIDIKTPINKSEPSNFIYGFITEENGKAIEDALVELKSLKDDSKFIASTLTNPQGEYLFSSLDSGIYSISVSKEGYITKSSSNIALQHHQYLGQSLVLSVDPMVNMSSVQGIITDDITGKLLEDIIVGLYSRVNDMEVLIKSAVTNNEGRYAFYMLLPGEYKIKASSFRKDDA